MALIAWVKRHANLLNFCFKIACLVGLVGTCALSTMVYFEYSVYFKLASYTPIELPVPRFSICVPTPALLDEKYEKGFFTVNESVATGKTLDYLLSVVPQPNTTVIKCELRQFETDRMFSLERSECFEFFRIKVYRLFGYICYRYTPPSYNYTMFSVVNTFTKRRVLYSTVVDKPLNQGYKLLPMLHHEEYPADDRVWDQELLPSQDSNESYRLSQVAYEMHRLPPPYSTNCGNESRLCCLTRCYQLGVKPYGIQPITNLPALDDMKAVFAGPANRYKGKTIFDIYRALEGSCEKKCEKSTKCEEIITKTVISAPETCKHKLAFSIETVSQPVTRLKTEKKFTFVELVFYCTSLGSIWIGFSFFGVFDELRTLCTRDKSEERLTQMVQICKRSIIIKKRIESSLLQQSLILQPPTNDVADRAVKPRYKPRTKKLIISTSLLLKIFITVGFFYQTYSITSSFFKFGTGTQLTTELDPEITAPSIAICIPWALMLGVPPLAEPTRDNYNSIFNATDATYSMPIGLIMNESWSSDRILYKCRYRRRETNKPWIHQLHTQEQCMRIFTARKFYLSGNICYSFHVRNNKAENQNRFKQRVSDPGIFYSIILNIGALESNQITVTLFSSNRQMPLESKEFAVTVYHTKNNRLLLVSPTSQRKISLPYPYEDRCNKLMSNAQCVQLCFREKSLAAFDRLPFHDIISQEDALNSLADKKLITFSILNSTEGINRWSGIEKECARRCYYDKCDLTVYNTLVNFGFPSKYKVELAVDVHSSPDVQRESVPQLLFRDYAYQFFSTASFWFAFTVLSTNPVTLLIKGDTQTIKSLRKNFKKVKKTTVILRQFIISLNKLFGMHLVYQSKIEKKPSRCHSLLRRLLKKNASICYNILKLLCAFGCVFHLFTAFTSYLEYPVTMKVLAKVEERSSRSYDLSICLSTSDTLRANTSLKLPKPSGFSRSLDDFPEIPIRDIFESTPSAKDILVACGHRGLKQSPLKNLTDRIYFHELNNAKRCHAIYSSQKFLLQEFICYKFSQKHVVDATKDGDKLLINHSHHILSLMINSSYITRNFLVTVSERGRPVAHSGVWAPTVTKKGDSVWMAFSYIKIVRHVLPPPFGNDGYTDSTLVGCMSNCLNRFLHKFSVLDPGLILSPPSRNFRYLTSGDLDEGVVRDLHQNYEDECKNRCYRANDHQSPTVNTFITLLNEWKYETSGSVQSVNRTQIHLTTTEYPVITITFIRSQPVIEFFIILGNIFGIWFGLSAVHCDPLRYVKKQRNISPDELTSYRLELDIVSTTIHQVYYFFFAWKN